MTNCETHPDIWMPEKLTCPLCAQEARRRAYAVQKAEMDRQLSWAVQGLLRPAQRDMAGPVDDQP